MWRTGLFLLGVPLVQLAHSAEKARAASPILVRDLTDGSNPDRSPRYSPDGKWIAFSSSRQGKPRIYVMPASGGAARAITPPDYISVSPTWSPDGKRIAFESDKDGGDGIWTIGLDGKGAVRVTPADMVAEAADWSRDGGRIAFLSRAAGSSDIYTISATGGDVRRITSHPGDEWAPRWSPDGKRIAFYTTWDGRMTDIWAVSAQGGDPVRLTNDPAEDYAPTWSPDGRWVAFFSRRGRNPADVWAVPSAGGVSRRIASLRFPNEALDWGRGGNDLVFMRNPVAHLFAVGVAGGPARQLTFGTSSAEQPTWSPDGRLLLFRSTLLSSDSHLTLARPDGRGTRALIPGETAVLHRDGNWSPNGRRVVFIRNAGGFIDTQELWTVSASGRELRRLATMAGIANPMWCDDRTVLFNAGGRVWRIAPGDVAPVALENAPRGSGITGWSAALHALILQSRDEGRSRLSLLALDGSAPRFLNTGTRTAEAGGISADGRMLAFLSNDSGQPDLYVVPVSGGTPRRLTNNSARESSPRWAPDGRTLVFSATTGLTALSKVRGIALPRLPAPMKVQLGTVQ